MNVHLGEAQPHMWDTTWAGKVQKMVDDNGVSKGIIRIFEERAINTTQMNADDTVIFRRRRQWWRHTC